MEIKNWTVYEPDFQWYKYKINDGKLHTIEKIDLKKYLYNLRLSPSQLKKVMYSIDTLYPFILFEFDNDTFEIQELTYKLSPEEQRKELELELKSKQNIIKNKEKDLEKEKPSLIQKIAKKILFSEEDFHEGTK